MLCPKCNAELTSDQKVCVLCGALTPASGYYYDDRPKFHFTKHLRIFLYIIGCIFFLFTLYFFLRVIPPQQVAIDWLNAMCNRRINYGASMITENFRSALSEQFSDMREVSDILYTDSSSAQSTLIVGDPDYQETAKQTIAIVPAALVDINGQIIRNMRVELVKEGRHWRINGFN